VTDKSFEERRFLIYEFFWAVDAKVTIRIAMAYALQNK